MEHSIFTIEPETGPSTGINGEQSGPARALVGADPFFGLDRSSSSSQQISYPTNEECANATTSHHLFYPVEEVKPTGLTDKQMPTVSANPASQELDPSLKQRSTQSYQGSTSELVLQGFQAMQSTLTQITADIKNLVVTAIQGKQQANSQRLPENLQLVDHTDRDHGPVMVKPPPISGPLTTKEMIKEAPVLSSNSHTAVDFNRISCPTPPLNLKDISQSLRDFESFCRMSEVPIAHQRRLLLEQLKQKAPHVLTEFVRAHETDPSYKALKSFLQSRFESVAPIHHLTIDPPYMNADAYSQFSKAVDLYKKTSPEDMVKFLVLRTSPRELQKTMANSLNLPYDRFFTKYKNKLEAMQSHTSPLARRQEHNQPPTQSQPLVSQRKDVPSTSTDRQRFDSKRYTLCEYHFQYGQRARNCNLQDCSMKHHVPAAIQASKNHQKNAPGQ